MTMPIPYIDNTEELETCEGCGEEVESLTDCPYCSNNLCDDCLADHEEDEGGHDAGDDEDEL